MIQDIIDEVLESEPRYTLRDSVGNVLNDNVDITLKTPVVEEGTPINRALFKNLQGDLYTTDRYNTITGYELVKTGEGTGNYWATNKAKSIEVFNDNSSSPIANMIYSATDVVGSFSTTYVQVGRITIHNKAPLKIKEIKIKGHEASGSVNNPKNFRIYGSNDGTSWNLMYVHSTEVDNTLTTLQINSEDFFDYIQFEFDMQENSNYTHMDALYVSSWEVGKHVLSLNLPLTSYERDKIVRIRNSAFKIHNANYTETTFNSGSVQPTFANSNVATNDYGTWAVSSNRRPLTNSYPAWKAFDKSTSTYYQAQDMYGFEAYIQLSSLETAGNKMWAIKPSSFYVNIHRNVGSAKIEGYNISTNKWETLKEWGQETFTNYDVSLVTTYSVSTTSYYSRFRLSFTAYSSSYDQPWIYEFRVQSGTIRSGIVKDIYVNAFNSNTYLNLNNIGEKLIDGGINYSNVYDLIYNGNIFNILNQDVITGTYVGNSNSRKTQQEIVLGFKPKLLIVGMQGELSHSMEWFASGNITFGSNSASGSSSYAYSAGYCELTNRGFVAHNGESELGHNYGYNYDGVIYKYIVLK